MNRVFRMMIHAWVALFCVLGGFAGYTLTSVPDVEYLRHVTPDTTSFMAHRLHQARVAGKPLNLQHDVIELGSIPRVLRRAIVVAEDASFWIHEGIDWHEMEEAFNRNMEEGRVVRGASTITQQTAKNLFLSPRRSLLRKVREFLITRELEYTLSKSRILELYLNSIEMGEGIFGIRTAARHYFGKEPNQLSLFEMARLVAIIPRPLGLDPREPDRELRWRSRVVLNRLYKYGFVTAAQYRLAREDYRQFFASL